MVNVCGVVGCSNNGTQIGRERKSFYRLPAIIREHGSRRFELSQARQKQWIANIGKSDFNFKATNYSDLRVCSDHFISGKPASLCDLTNPDWAPTLKIGHNTIAVSAACQPYILCTNRKLEKILDANSTIKHDEHRIQDTGQVLSITVRAEETFADASKTDACAGMPDQDNLCIVSTVSCHSEYQDTTAESSCQLPGQFNQECNMELLETDECAVIKQEVDTSQVQDYNETQPGNQNICYAETGRHHNVFLESTAAVLKQYRAESFLCDIILLVDDGELPAHSVILAAASPVFKAGIGLLEGKPTPYQFRIRSVKKVEMEFVLNAIYSGRLDLYLESRVNVKKVLDILKVDVCKMEEHVIPSSCKFPELHSNISTINVVNAVGISHTAQPSKLNYGSIEDLNNINPSSFQSRIIKPGTRPIFLKRFSRKCSRKFVIPQAPRTGIIRLNLLREILPKPDGQTKQTGGPVFIQQLESNSTIAKNSMLHEDGETKADSTQLGTENGPGVNVQDITQDVRFNIFRKPCKTARNWTRKRKKRNRILKVRDIRRTYKSTGRCPCQKCQTDSSKAVDTGTQVIHCDYCLYRTDDINRLVDHLRRKHKNKMVPNDTTSGDNEVAMKSDIGADTHPRFFTPIDPPPDGKYMCELCSAVFDSESEIFDHKVTHQRERMIKCDVCGKVLQKQSLILHRRSHTGETPELCHLCGEQFDRRASLNNHLMIAHADVENALRPATIKCPSCTRLFRLPSSLAWHMQQAHGLPYYTLNLNEGETADFVCENCGASFNKRKQFHTHRQSCGFKKSSHKT